MKKEILKTVSFCDSCGKEDQYLEKCLSCGIEHCSSCQQKGCGKRYRHGVNYGGPGDGYYCIKCDAKLSESKQDPLHNAYVAIANLIAEQDNWSFSFNQRCDNAQNEIQIRLRRRS